MTISNLNRDTISNDVSTSTRTSTSTKNSQLTKGSDMKKKKQPIPPHIRQQVWVDNFSSAEEGKCYCCKKILEKSTGWHCGHIHSEHDGGGIISSNMRPVCRKCNLTMGTTHMYLWMVTEGYGENLVGDSPSISIHKEIFRQFTETKKYLQTLMNTKKITDRDKRSYINTMKKSKNYKDLFNLLDTINYL